MSINGANGEDAEMAECEGEKVVTMMDVLKEQQEFEEDANAVLGASDDKNCTYSKGYVKRQAVYACLTCCNEAKHDADKRAGVCLACSLTCHENHDLVELYTKRNFRCDCGNPKFNNSCQYTDNKTSLNEGNTYNQNFSGLYCTCHRPYPDPDGVDDEMIQCIVCEDWLHYSHLEATVPSPELYAEMICKACMDKNGFLHDYSKYAVNDDVDVVEVSQSDDSKSCNGNTTDLNGADSEPDKTKSEDINEDKLTTVDYPIEAMAISPHYDENNPQEQIKLNVLVTNKAEDENLATEKSDDGNQIVTTPAGMSDGKSIKNNVAQEISTSNTDDANPSDENQVKDKEEEQTFNFVDSKLGDNFNSVASSSDQENLSTTDNKDDDPKYENNPDPSLLESPTDTLQESKGAGVNDDLHAEDKKIEDLNTASLEKPDLTVSSDTSADNKNVEMLHKQVTDNSTGDEEIKETNGAGDNDDLHAEDKKIEELNIASLEKPDLTDTSSDNKNIETQHKQVTDNSTGDEEIKENKRKLSTEEGMLDVSAKKPKLCESDCLRPQGERKMFKGATFWPSQFRQKLCTCNECIAMYKDLSVLFLIDLEDTVTAYEVLGKEKTDGTASTQYEKGLEALSSLGRIQQINALTEYNKMRDKLLDFLKSFKDRKEVVKEEDIKAFFAGMKPKREPDGVYFCR